MICVLEFIPHTYTAMAHGEELGEIAGVQGNLYEGKGRLSTSGRDSEHSYQPDYIMCP